MPTPSSDFWIEVYPEIDLKKRVIFSPQVEENKKKNYKYSKIDDSSLIDLFNEIPENHIEKSDEFFSTIPVEISNAAKRFPDSHWQLVKGIAFIGKDILSLISTNPTFAYVIINFGKINSSYFCYDEIELLKKMILTKQKKILSLCGFPGTERIVKIFSKIDPDIISTQNMIRFRNLLIEKSATKERVLKILSHTKTINKKLFNLILFNTHLINLMPYKLIYDLADSKKFDENIVKLKRILKESNHSNIKIPEIKSLDSLDKVYEKLKTTIKANKRKLITFPAPPIEENDSIAAIRDRNALLYWSRRQQNCIRQYAKKVQSGRSYFYRVKNNKEEATLEIEIKGNKVSMGSLLGVRNSSVSDETREMVVAWFKEFYKN